MPEPLDRPDWPWLSQRAGTDPDGPAIVWEKRTISFRDLAQKVETIAGRISALGVRAGDRIALLMDSSLRMVEVIHAAQRCGATLVPLNTRLSAAEIEALLIDADPRLLLYDLQRAESVSQLRSQLSTLRFVEAYRDLDAAAAISPPGLSSLDLSAIHTILYSSGTTGTPKGVMLTHANHWASASASRAHLGIEPNDRWLLMLPLYHVGGLSIVLRSVIDGVPFHLHPDFNPARANAALRAEKITLVSVVSTMLLRMLDENGGERYPGTLRCVLLGGGPIPEALVRRAIELGAPVAPTYGLTEAASQVATAMVGDSRVRPRSCGRPLSGIKLKLGSPDASGRGEIQVNGPTVMAGYFRQHGAGIAALRDGWLHTGDIGHFDCDGFLYIDDRRSDLIVTGGENVYPAEVENVLLAHPAVAEAAVYGVVDSQWGQRVAAAVVVRDGFETEAALLREWCENRLARFKLPKTIDFLEALPRTASGKIKRYLLRQNGDPVPRFRGTAHR